VILIIGCSFPVTEDCPAGSKNAEYALFPYYTDDKITEFADITGNKSIFQIKRMGKKVIWEPFSNRKNIIKKPKKYL
jgi:hypothetical protein